MMQQLDLGQRELERAHRLEQIGVAVLVQVDHHGVQVGGEPGRAGRLGWPTAVDPVGAAGELGAAPDEGATPDELGAKPDEGATPDELLTCTHASIACKLYFRKWKEWARSGAAYGWSSTLLELGRGGPMWSAAGWILVAWASAASDCPLAAVATV